MQIAPAFLVAAPRREPARPARGARARCPSPWPPGWGCRGREALPFTGQGDRGVLGKCSHRGGFWSFLSQGSGGRSPGSGEVLRSNSKRLGKIARIRSQGTPNLKTAEIGAGVLGKMPQPIRAPLEVMNMWMEIPSWAFYGLRAAGCGFAPHAKVPQWKTGVTSSKTSAPIPLVQLDPTPKGCSHSALAPGRLSRLLGLVLLPRMLEQGCGKGWERCW